MLITILTIFIKPDQTACFIWSFCTIISGLIWPDNNDKVDFVRDGGDGGGMSATIVSVKFLKIFSGFCWEYRKSSKFYFNWIFAVERWVMRSHWVAATAVMNITQSAHFLLDHNYCCPRSECLANHNQSQTRNGNHLISAPAQTQPVGSAWCCSYFLTEPCSRDSRYIGTTFK